ncbi:hypothetical protein BYT27DRAFT_7202700 [Phlegmacium glaucopus]|nr:hypothetical protein BYT27DRAFT_7202700 [Phlegmacium glaucopus]
MDSLRRRIPFKLVEDDDDDDNNSVSDIYDEQQQEFMIQELRQEADTFNRKALLSLRILVSLSCIIQVLFNNLQNNPFLAFFSPEESTLSAPLRIILSIPSFFVHYLLAVFLSSQFRDNFFPYNRATLSYRFVYSVSVLAPTISLCSQIPWKVAIWWSYTPLLVFAVHRVMNSFEDINRGIANLEALKYRAPGA